jgi:hypothetical protein
MSTPPEPTPRAGDSWRWWESRRLRYNIGLAIAGWVAWGLAAAAIWTLVPLIPFQTDNPEVTLFTVLIQGVLYLLFMAAANLLYLLGSLSEAVLRPADVDGFRRRMFGLGFWFSVALPFAFPAMTLISLLSMVGT